MQSHCHRTPPARHQESHGTVRQTVGYQQRQAMPGHGEKLRTGLRPRGYFNWNAEVLAITWEEVENFEKATKQQEEQNRKRQTEAEKPRKKSRNMISYPPTHRTQGLDHEGSGRYPEGTGSICGNPGHYIADGHHRAASAVKVGQMRRKAHPGYTGEEPFNYSCLCCSRTTS